MHDRLKAIDLGALNRQTAGLTSGGNNADYYELSSMALVASSALLPFTVSSAESGPMAASPGPEVTGPMTFATQLASAVGSFDAGQATSVRMTEDPLEAQNVAAQMLSAIRERTSETYVSSGVELDGAQRPTGRYWLNFTVQPPEWVQKQLDAQSFPTVVTWGFNASANRLSELTKQLSDQLGSNPDVAHYDVGPSEGMGVSGIDIKLVASGDREPAALAEQAVGAANAAIAPQAGVDSKVDEPSSAVPVVYEGASDNAQAFGTEIKGGYSTSGCTLGFAANYGGQAGVVTASHCDDSDGIWPYNGQNYIIGAPTLDALGQQWDVQFNPRYNSNHTVGRSFKSSAGGAITDVTAVVDPMPNQSLCKYGDVTDRDCGQTNPLTVAERDRCTTFQFLGGSTNYTVCHAYRMSRSVTTQGDSGGPWFSGGGAYGTTIGQGDYSWFTGMWVASQHLGIYIRR